VSAASSASRPDGLIEIVLPSGVSMRVDTRVDSGALRRVLTALKVRGLRHRLAHGCISRVAIPICVTMRRPWLCGV
jgi:hypothetical protein